MITSFGSRVPSNADHPGPEHVASVSCAHMCIDHVAHMCVDHVAHMFVDHVAHMCVDRIVLEDLVFLISSIPSDS